MLRALGLPVERVAKLVGEEGPTVVDVIHQGLVDCVINTPQGGQPTAMRDGFHIRRAAAERRIPCFTSIDTARAATDALLGRLNGLPVDVSMKPGAPVPAEQSYTVQPLRLYLDGRKKQRAQRSGQP